MGCLDFPERLKKKINFLTDLTCWDHHKSRDLQYGIKVNYSAYDDSATYYPFHNGYIWDTEIYKFHEVKIDNFDVAVQMLEFAVDNQIDEQLEWFVEYIKDPEKYDMVGSPITTQEELDEYKDKYVEILRNNV